jgi:hypothetical protein
MKDKNGHGYFKRNGLSLVFLILFLFSLGGQAYTGWHEHNEDLKELGQPSVDFHQYLQTGHFIQATFENWESEFLQMALFVILTIFLRQRGSSESKKLDDPVIDNETLIAKEDSPWPVKKGGFALKFYKHSLSLILILIFLVAFWFHFYGSWLDQRDTEILEGKQPESMGEFVLSTKMWFESFQNWQSEFLSVFAIVYLSIYLRQVGSSQSKPVNAPHSQTGSD